MHLPALWGVVRGPGPSESRLAYRKRHMCERTRKKRSCLHQAGLLFFKTEGGSQTRRAALSVRHPGGRREPDEAVDRRRSPRQPGQKRHETRNEAGVRSGQASSSAPPGDFGMRIPRESHDREGGAGRSSHPDDSCASSRSTGMSKVKVAGRALVREILPPSETARSRARARPIPAPNPPSACPGRTAARHGTLITHVEAPKLRTPEDADLRWLGEAQPAPPAPCSPRKFQQAESRSPPKRS